MLRAFQRIRGARPDPGFAADLGFMQSKDLDLSVRIGALLAFDALLITAGINPLTASPGAPLSMDAAAQRPAAIVIALGMLILAAAALACVRAILIGEEFAPDGIEDDAEALAQRLLAVYAASLDAQARLVARAGWLTLLGGLVTIAGCAWVLIAKMI